METHFFTGAMAVFSKAESLRIEVSRSVQILSQVSGEAIIWIFPNLKPLADEADGIRLPEPIAARLRAALLG